MVITPSPPRVMAAASTTCPKIDQCVAVSTTVSPVTQTEEAAVKKASTNVVLFPGAVEAGRSSAPVVTAIRKRKMTIVSRAG